MGLDEILFHSINGVAGRSSLLDWVMVELAKPGNLLYPILLAAAYWFWKNQRECLIGAAALAGVIGAADALGTQLKRLVQRPRPCVTLADVHQLLGCGGAFSFPSNHAANTAAAAAFFQVLYPKSGWIGWPLVAAIGISRVYIGAHYLTDVMGGWVLGGLIGAGAAWSLTRWSRFRPPAERMAPAVVRHPSAGSIS
ncbi:MAG TPA: phosphatase PAP2 family protein [Nitrospira sp.]|nr:phosphatase PAP2 family protein [Nitrospira sp.]